MTVTIDQAMRGAMRYADNEVIPHLPGGKRSGACSMLALIMEGSREKVLALRENPAVKMMQIFDDAVIIDLDKLYNAARPRFENKLTVSVPQHLHARTDIVPMDWRTRLTMPSILSDGVASSATLAKFAAVASGGRAPTCSRERSASGKSMWLRSPS